MGIEQDDLCGALMEGYEYAYGYINKECIKYLFKLISETLNEEQKKEILEKYNKKCIEELKKII